MTRAERTRLKWAVTFGGVLWLVLSGWLMIATLPYGAVENHGTAAVRDRMDSCGGSFRERFDCKEQIIVESGRETFFTFSTRFLLVILPPMFATGWLSSFLRRSPIDPDHRHVEVGDWKTRAQMHTNLQSPEEAAQALHMHAEDLPAHHQHHLHVTDIAPVEDWKAKAQVNVRTKKPS